MNGIVDVIDFNINAQNKCPVSLIFFLNVCLRLKLSGKGWKRVLYLSITIRSMY